MAITKILFGASSVAVTVATSECANTTYGPSGANPFAMDSSGNIWFSHNDRISMCLQNGECISKHAKAPEGHSEHPRTSIAVDDSGPVTFVYLVTTASDLAPGPMIMQCVWDVNSADEEVSCSVFAQRYDVGKAVFAGHEGNVFIWHPVCSVCGMLRCSSSGECEEFGGDFAERFHDAVTDSHDNVYLTSCGGLPGKERLCNYAKCTPSGNCAEMEFTGPNGLQLRGGIAIGPDDEVYMADHEPSHSDEVGLFRCSPDNVCDHISALNSGFITPYTHHTFRDILLGAGNFIIDKSGDFYSHRWENHWEFARQCLPPRVEEIQI